MILNKKLFFTIFLFLFSITIHSQTSLNIYPLSGNIGIKFFSERKISLEPRMEFQYDLADGESNVFLNIELQTTVKVFSEDKFNMYSGLGLGSNLYNQGECNLTGSIPIGATYFITNNNRLAIIGECGIKMIALDYLKINSYALVGLQIRLGKPGVR